MWADSLPPTRDFPEGEDFLEEFPLGQVEHPPSVGDLEHVIKELELRAVETLPAKQVVGVEANGPYEAALASAASTGVVDIRSALGQRFSAEVRKSEKLAQDYQACLGVKAKQEFRAAWASEKWSVLSQQRTEKKSQTFSEFSKGKYLSLTVVFQKSGGDQRAVEATKTRLNKCMALGPPFVRISPWTSQFELLMIQDGLSEKFEQLWRQTLTSQTSPSVAVPAATTRAVGRGSGAEPARPSRKRGHIEATTEDSPNEKKPSRPHGKVSAQNPTAPARNAGIAAVLKKQEKNKAIVQSAGAAASELAGLIDAASAWAWARNEQNAGALTAAIQELSALKTDFVKSWLTLDSHAMRTLFPGDVVEREFAETIPALVKAAIKLSEQVTRLQKMRVANAA